MSPHTSVSQTKLATPKRSSSSMLTSVIISFSVLLYAITTSCQQVSTMATASVLTADTSNSIIQQFKTIANNNQQQQVITTSFSTPNQAINITHVTYDPLYDAVYLGATNNIYQLNGSDLSLLFEQTTGPIFDNPNCGITECHGFEDYMKPTQNVNKVLVIDYQHKKLLSCGSTKQGACRRYQLNNIAQKEDLIPMAVAANDDNSSTYAFIAPARYTYDPSTTSSSVSNMNNINLMSQQQVLYVASTYTKTGQSRELLVPAIGTRTLDDGPNLLKLYENSFLDSARIDINSHLRDYFLVNYLYGFASSNYIYFVTVQKKATSRDFEELGYHTRLARICITDSSYNSYTEVDLKCVPNKRKAFPSPKQQSSEYPLLQDAILVDAGSQLLQSLAQNDQTSSSSFLFGHSSSTSSSDDNKVLLGVFSSARDHTQHPGDHSAICAFSLAQIEEKFNDNIHSCYTGKMQSRNMEYIAGNVQECPKNGQGGNVVNFCHETLKINGTIPIVSEASIQFQNTTLTAITATSHINSPAKNIYSEQLTNELSISTSSNGPSFKRESTPPSASSLPAYGNIGQQLQLTNRQHTVVFAGTSNGHIKKILLNNATNGQEFEDVQLDTNPILSDLHLHSSGQQLIAATPYKVMKVPTHNCAQYSSCRECSQSKNPYCGWCSLKKSCTTKSECVPSPEQQQQSHIQPAPGQTGSQQSKWISFDSTGKCIDLHAIVPDKIPMISTGKIDLYIDRLPRLPQGHSYKCIFNRSEQTSATQTTNGLSCPLPKLMDRQKYIQIEPGKDHAIVDLAVRSSETNRDFLDGKIAFFECQHHTSCQDCLSTNWGCNWCMNENICLFNASKCERSPQQQATGSRSNGDQELIRVMSASSPQPVAMAGSSQRGSTVIAASSSRSSPANTINQVQQCPNYDPALYQRQQQHQQQSLHQQADIFISDASDSRDKSFEQQHYKSQQRFNNNNDRPQTYFGSSQTHSPAQMSDYAANFASSSSSSPIPMLAGQENLGRRMLLQQQHQQQQEALFTSTIWTPHLRQPYQPPPPPTTFYGQPPPKTISTSFDSALDDLQMLQQANPATKQQQLQSNSFTGTSQIFYSVLVSLSLLLSVALVALLLLGSNKGRHYYQHRFARLPLDKLEAFRNWLSAGRNLSGSGISGRASCLHHRHLYASECAKCSRAASSPDEISAASPWPIVGGFSSSTTSNSSGILGTLRAPHLAPNSSSIIVGLNPIARLQGHHQIEQNSRTISNHIKQQFCFATQASKVSSVMDNYGMGGGNSSNHGYYSSMNYNAENGGRGDSIAAYRQHQPPTADLLGTGYQCHQQQHQSAFQQPASYRQFGTLGHNNSQTTRLIWQQSPNGTNPTEPNNSAGYLIDGGSYMPLSSNSSGNAPVNGHSGSGSPIYQSIYG